MNRKSYQLKGTPVVPSLCAILMAILWYVDLTQINKGWETELRPFSFEGLTGFAVYGRIMTLLIPLSFFVCVLFLAEWDLRWVLLALLPPVVLQVSFFVKYLLEEGDYFFENPLSFLLPFLTLILFVLTVEGILPGKWIFVGYCAVAALLPVILTLCGVGEFFAEGYRLNPADYQYEQIAVRYWSEVFSLSLYNIGMGALALQMKSAGAVPSAEASEEAPVDPEPDEAEASPEDL